MKIGMSDRCDASHGAVARYRNLFAAVTQSRKICPTNFFHFLDSATTWRWEMGPHGNRLSSPWVESTKTKQWCNLYAVGNSIPPFVQRDAVAESACVKEPLLEID